MSKSASEKCKECVTIRTKMNELGFDRLQESQLVYKKMNEFIKTDEEIRGRLFIPSLQKFLVYNFITKIGKDSNVLLTK
jgi:hypothetical protein